MFNDATAPVGRGSWPLGEGITVGAAYPSILDDNEGRSMLDVDVRLVEDVALQAGYDVCHKPSS